MDDKIINMIIERLDRIENKLDETRDRLFHVQTKISKLEGKIIFVATVFASSISASAMSVWDWIKGGQNG